MSAKQKERFFPKKDTLKEMVERSAAFDTLPQPYHVGDFVYMDTIPKGLSKGTDQKRGQIYAIKDIFKDQKVVRYNLVDLGYKRVIGSVYRQNLRKVPLSARPTTENSDFFQ